MKTQKNILEILTYIIKEINENNYCFTLYIVL
jgi:hypothetical protein